MLIILGNVGCECFGNILGGFASSYIIKFSGGVGMHMAGFPSHNIFLLQPIFLGFLDLCVPVLEVRVSSWAPGYFYLRF